MTGPQKQGTYFEIRKARAAMIARGELDCSKCKQVYQLEQFTRESKNETRGGYSSRCKHCSYFSGRKKQERPYDPARDRESVRVRTAAARARRKARCARQLEQIRLEVTTKSLLAFILETGLLRMMLKCLLEAGWLRCRSCDQHFPPGAVYSWREGVRVRARCKPCEQVRLNQRRAQKVSSGTFTRAEWQEVIRRQNGRCCYCQERARLTMDHVIPLSKGGEHTQANIVGACHGCNSAKGTRDAGDFTILHLA